MVLNFHVENLVIKLQQKVVCISIKEQFILVSNIPVADVVIKQHQKVI